EEGWERLQDRSAARPGYDGGCWFDCKDHPRRQADEVNIDVGGLGVGVYDRLIEQGFGHVVYAVKFGGKPTEPPPLDETGKPAGGPANRRAEMWLNLNCRGHFAIPDCVDCILISARRLAGP